MCLLNIHNCTQRVGMAGPLAPGFFIWLSPKPPHRTRYVHFVENHFYEARPVVFVQAGKD